MPASSSSKKPRANKAPHRPRAARDRVHFRIDARIKERAQNAATLLGQDFSTFAESALDEKAREIIEREEKIVLSERDFALFSEAIANPQPVGARLREAAEKYNAIRRDHPELNW